MCSAGLLGAFSTSWEVLAMAMFGMGFSYGVLVDASMTLASETVGPKYRIVQTLAFQWSLALQVSLQRCLALNVPNVFRFLPSSRT